VVVAGSDWVESGRASGSRSDAARRRRAIAGSLHGSEIGGGAVEARGERRDVWGRQSNPKWESRAVEVSRTNRCG